MACVLSGFPNLVSFHFRVCLAPVLSSEVLFSIYLPVVFKDQGL